MVSHVFHFYFLSYCKCRVEHLFIHLWVFLFFFLESLCSYLITIFLWGCWFSEFQLFKYQRSCTGVCKLSGKYFFLVCQLSFAFPIDWFFFNSEIVIILSFYNSLLLWYFFIPIYPPYNLFLFKPHTILDGSTTALILEKTLIGTISKLSENTWTWPHIHLTLKMVPYSSYCTTLLPWR